MTIHFPKTQEVPLASPPLDEVICQVRFPPILRIANEEPVDFQELIRGRYPVIQKKHTFQLQLAEPGNPGESSIEPQPIMFLFTNPDDKGQLALSPGFYAVSTERYVGWDAFMQDLKLAHETVGEIYQPAFSTRIGLRYINRLTTSNTQATTQKELFKLIRKELTATLRGKVWENAAEMFGVVNFTSPAEQMNLRYGYEIIDTVPTFLLDFDVFEEGRLDLSEVLSRCERYHEEIYHAFRWSITKEALDHFGGTV